MELATSTKISSNRSDTHIQFHDALKIATPLQKLHEGNGPIAIKMKMEIGMAVMVNV